MSKLAILEGFIENGNVESPPDIGIPAKTRVYVVGPNSESISAPYVASPHLVSPEKAKDFAMRIIEDSTDANE